MSETLRSAQEVYQKPDQAPDQGADLERAPGAPEEGVTPDNGHDSPPWSLMTKAIVASAALILLALVVWRFSFLLSPLITAGVIAYLLNPLISWLRAKVGISRASAVLIVYAVLLIMLGVLGTFAARIIATQSSALWSNLPGYFEDLVQQVERRADELESFTFGIGPYRVGLGGLLESVDWDAVAVQLRASLQSIAGRSGAVLANLFQRTLSTLSEALLVFIISIYIAIDAPRIGVSISEAAQPSGYRRDAERLVQATLRIWDAYLRGQVTLGLIIGVVVWLTLTVLGVNNAFELGILSGLLEFLPIIGPVIGAGAAVLVALLQNSNPWSVSPWLFALIVLGAMILIQQVENGVLVPRIVGDALDLHPVVVMVGVIMGTSLAGLLGAILAAPVLATLKLYGIYVWRKLLDLPPFVNMPVPEKSLDYHPPSIGAAWSQLISWLGNRRK